MSDSYLAYAESCVQVPKAELDQLRAEIAALISQRQEFDCCYTNGNVADILGIHCPPGSPCMKCENQKLRESRDKWRKLANTWCYAYESPSSFINDGSADADAYATMARLEQSESEASDEE